jgi:hypothetical protein
MKTNPRNTRGFFTLLAYHERSRHSTAFPSLPLRPGTVIGSAHPWIPRIETALPRRQPNSDMQIQPRRKITA